MKFWYWRNGEGWRYRYTRFPRRLAREAEEQRRAQDEARAAEDRLAAERLKEQGRRKIEAWQMPDDFFGS